MTTRDQQQPATMPDPLCQCGHRASHHADARSGDARYPAVEVRADLTAAFEDGCDSDHGYCACLCFTADNSSSPRA